jgi:hypothetical protein
MIFNMACLSVTGFSATACINYIHGKDRSAVAGSLSLQHDFHHQSHKRNQYLTGLRFCFLISVR